MNMTKIFLVRVVAVLLFLCGWYVNSVEQQQNERMNMESIIMTLDENEIEYHVFRNDQGNEFLVVPKFGGRILAASVGGESLFWSHPDVFTGQGGQRSWISPEGGPKGFVFEPDWSGNRDFSMMDPGQYEVTRFDENEFLRMQNTFQTDSNDEEESYDLTLTREMRLLRDPAGTKSELMGFDYEYLGIYFVHKLKNNSEMWLDRILALWCLIQVPARGTMIVPVQAVENESWRGNYFEPIPEEYVRVNSDSFSYFIHGSKRYKVGIRPQSVTGVVCYLSQTESAEPFMVFMTFPVKPQARYVDKPQAEQDSNGDTIQIYSHMEEGGLAFGEMECHSWALDLKPGDEKAFPIQILMYKAPLETLKKIGRVLVCRDFDRAHIL
jgi:hypothetical protein